MFCVPGLELSLQSRDVGKPSPPPPEAQPGSQACSLPWPGVLWVRGGWGGGVPSSRVGVGPAPTAAACRAWWPHRQTGLVRAGGLQGELSSCWQLLKGLIVAEGSSTGSCPRLRHRQSPAFVPAHCPCPDPGSAGQRLLSAGGWGPPRGGAALDPQMA